MENNTAATPAQPIAPQTEAPQGFIEYVQANYHGTVEFLSPEWHAKRLWAAAMHQVKVAQPIAVSAPTDELVEAALAVYMAAWTERESMAQCKRNGIRAVLEWAARAAAPVSGPSEQYRAFIETWAARNGWDKNDGEGAFEYIQRISYKTGWDDAMGPERNSAAPVQCAKLTITNNGDEEVSYELNGQHMITANHDDDGWSGMERINALMMKVAAEIGAEVETVEGEDDE